MRATLPEALYNTRKRLTIGAVLAVVPLAPLVWATTQADSTDHWWPGAVLITFVIPLILGVGLICWVPRRPSAPGADSPIAPGWYPDRAMVNTMRYWDGQQWTDQTQFAPPRAASIQPWQIAIAVCAGLALFVLLFGGL